MTDAGTRDRARRLAPGSREIRRRGSVVGRTITGASSRLARRAGAPGRRTDEAEVAAILEAVARSLRNGSSLVQALAAAVDAVPGGDASDALRSALVLHARGAPVRAVVDAWATGSTGRARSVAGAALALGSELGGARADALDGAAAALRDRAELHHEMRALTSQARSSATALVLAPLGFAVYAWTADRRVAGLMFTTPFGWACLVGGLLLDALGGWWMARLASGVA